MKIIAVDAGNSHLRFSIVDTEKLECSKRVFCSYENFEEKLSKTVSSPLLCSVSTVVELAKISLKKIAEKSELISETVFCTPQISPLKLEYNSKTIGVDRVADALAATKLYPNRDLIVIDSGTATTVDAISSNATFLGGFILPGLKLKAESLFEKTDKLPKTDLYNLSLTQIPKTTEEAIVSGLILDTVGGIEKAVSALSKSLKNPIILGCGGGWEILENCFNNFNKNYVTNKNLTLLGTGLLGEFTINQKEEK